MVLILLGLKATAQSKLDSLWNVWEDATKPDSSRANALEDYIYEGYFYSNPDSASILAEQLYDFTHKTADTIGMVNAMELAGYNFFRMGDYPKALSAYHQGLEIAEKNKDKKGIANILLKTGFIYHDNEDLIRALNYYQRSLKIFEELNDLDGIGSIYNEFGSIYRIKEDFETSLDYYLKSIAISNKLNNKDGNAAQYLNIASLYLDHDDFGKAIENFKKGLAIYEKLGDKLGIASGLSGLGSVNKEQGNQKEALDYLQGSLTISEQIHDAQGAAATLLSIGEIYAKQGEHHKAINICKKSLLLSEDLGDIGNQESSCECLYNAYKSLGNLNEALRYHEQMLVFSDSIENEASSKKLQQIEFSKRALADSLVQVEKERAVEMAHQSEVQKKDKNRNLAIAVGVFFLLLSIGFYSRWRYVKKSKAIIEKEKDRSENLLLNILPAAIAAELKEKGEAAARDFDLVSILFSDFKGYTEKSEKLSAQELISEINHCFMAFDHICEKYGIEKIKTIGDAYMAAGGLPVPSDHSVLNTILAALEMQDFMADRMKVKRGKNEISFEMRLGIHTGPVVAGIVGVKKFQYDIWGDTVNIASRMESNGEIGRVNISQYTFELIKVDPRFTFEPRGKLEVKGKGEMEMWFVDRKQ